MTYESAEKASEKIVKDCSSLKSRLGVEVLFGGIAGDKPETGLTAAELGLIEGNALWILANARNLIESPIGQKSIDFAAETLEYLTAIQGGSIASNEIPLAFYSAILYGSEGKFPNTTIMSKKLESAYKKNLIDAKTLGDLFNHLLYCSQLLLANDYVELRKAATIDESAHQKLQTILDTYPTYSPEFTGIILGIEALRIFSSYVLTGKQDLWESCQQHLLNARKFSRGDSMLSQLERYLTIYSEVVSSCHVDRVLEPYRTMLSDDYINLLKHSFRPITTLWPPQIRALRQDYLSANHVGISMPTSSGKTLLAEMKIQVELKKNPSALIFYVVPLNALARQIQRDLQERLRLAPLRYNIKVLTGTYEIEDKDLSGVREENVIITTPEKLDGLLRNIDNQAVKDYFERCCLFIFDECHSIGDGKRGITYELLIARLRKAFPDAKTLSLSAVFSNVDNFINWIGQDQGTVKVVTDSWRPTGSHWATWSITGGFVYEGKWVNSDYKRPSDTKAAAAQLAVDMQRAYKNVLVIAESRDSCEKYATALVKAVREANRPILTPDEQRKLNILAVRIRNRVLRDSKLAEWVEFGVAYHHGHLPSDVRVWIEDYIADGTLKFVVATTTLSEGVNFPIRCVILPNIYLGGKVISAIKLRNIIGRAGRAHVSTSGMAVVFKSWENIPVDNYRLSFDKYCFDPPASIMRTSSAVKDLLQEANSFYHVTAQQALESQVLAFLSLAGMQVENQALAIAKSSFLMSTNPELESALTGLIESRIKSMESYSEPLIVSGSPYHLTNYGKHVSKTGLGLRDSSKLMQSLREIVGKIPNYFEHLENNDRLDSDKIKNILLLAFTTYESLLSSYGVQANCKEISGSSISNVKQDSLDFLNAFDTNAYFRSRINDAVLGLDIELIWRWINGETPQHLGVLLSEKYPRLNGKVETATIEAINFIENLQYSIGWPLYAIKVLINFLIEEKVIKGSISPQFDNLPYYLKHGVAHPVSVAIMEKIQNPDFRKDSMLIASGYNVEISYILNHEEIFSSVTDMGEEQISEILKDKTRAKELWGLLMSK